MTEVLCLNLLFIYSLGKERWIHAFSNGINAKGNTNNPKPEFEVGPLHLFSMMTVKCNIGVAIDQVEKNSEFKSAVHHLKINLVPHPMVLSRPY